MIKEFAVSIVINGYTFTRDFGREEQARDFFKTIRLEGQAQMSATTLYRRLDCFGNTKVLDHRII